jgi:hypothetical protein
MLRRSKKDSLRVVKCVKTTRFYSSKIVYSYKDGCKARGGVFEGCEPEVYSTGCREKENW